MGFNTPLPSVVETFVRHVLNKDSDVKVSADVAATVQSNIATMDGVPAKRRIMI